MLNEAIELFRSNRAAECEDRAFVLTAVGVPNEIAVEGGHFVLWVNAWAFAQARHHIERHAAENAVIRPAAPVIKPFVHPHAWLGSIFYTAVLLFVSGAIANGVGPLNLFQLGDLDAARVQHGEWWRAWTALTLHLSIDHLALNLGAGIWLGFLAGRRLGYGIAWMLIVTGAALANLLEGLGASPAHRAVGASTAVFAALGLLAAYAWAERYHLPQAWARRWGPLVAGVILLGIAGTGTGTEGDNTDVFAHIAGFSVAALLGAFAALPMVRVSLQRIPQWLGAVIALGSIAAAWTFAILAAA
jgi:membrane associated rhomboid family serine protease